LKKREEKASRRTREKLLICLRMREKPQSKTGNKRLREPHKTRSAKRTSAAEQKREQRMHAAPKNSSSLSSLAAHPTSSPSYSRPVRCCPPQLAN